MYVHQGARSRERLWGRERIQNDERGPGEPFHRKITFVNRTRRIEQEGKKKRGGERRGACSSQRNVIAIYQLSVHIA